MNANPFEQLAQHLRRETVRAQQAAGPSLPVSTGAAAASVAQEAGDVSAALGGGAVTRYSRLDLDEIGDGWVLA